MPDIEIVEIETFKRAVKKERIIKEYVEILKSELRNYPERGVLIQDSGGLRKIRMALPNTGKRGGARVIYLYISLKERIYLITAYRKSGKDNLTSDDLKAFRELIKVIKAMEN